MIWRPNVTVAAVIEHEGKFLMIEEHTSQGPKFNQPAGHLEANESIHDAVVRETREESAYEFQPEYLIGIYHWHSTASDITYLRFAFAGTLAAHYPEQLLDEGIIRATWMTAPEIRYTQTLHRSPLVMRCVDDFLAGQKYPLNILTHYE